MTNLINRFFSKQTGASTIQGLQYYDQNDINQWKNLGNPLPPPHAYKVQVIKYFSETLAIKVLVETGTYLGQTVKACLAQFEKIYSVEIDDHLYQQAQSKFKGENTVELLHGDSGELMPGLISEIQAPAIFWLDGHYSGGITGKGSKNTPIVEELHAILASKYDHLILIDDARCFIGEQEYPTIFELKSIVERQRPDFKFSLKHDIMRIGKLPSGLQV